MQCPARKYTAFKSKTEAHICHHGDHTCVALERIERPAELVRSSLQIEPRISPSTIQSNAILSSMRCMKDWSAVEEVVHAVISKKQISNEKVKQNKTTEPDGTGFDGVKNLKHIHIWKTNSGSIRLTRTPKPSSKHRKKK